MPRGIYPKGNKGLFKKGQNLGNTNGFKKGHKMRVGVPSPWARNNPQTFRKGRQNPNKGISSIKSRPCKNCGNYFTPNNFKDSQKFCSKTCYQTFNRGQNNSMWKGGITPINKIIRTSKEYKLWRKSVFERDNYTCVWCGARSQKENPVVLHADHIKPFAYYPELRFAIDNGRTLCKECHMKTDTYAGRCKQ